MNGSSQTSGGIEEGRAGWRPTRDSGARPSGRVATGGGRHDG